MKNNTRLMILTALLTAMAIIIPIQFGFLAIKIPPYFSATIASHVPMFLGMILGPVPAAFIGIGSALGFLITTTPEIAGRAAMHIVVGALGAVLLRKKISYQVVIGITAPIHAVLEAVIIFILTNNIQLALLTVGVGTFIHHFVDGALTFALVKSLAKTKVPYFGNKTV